MKFKIDTKIPVFREKINYERNVIFYGSCFSDEISKKFKNGGFQINSNPFGTIFHPIVLAQNIQNSICETVNSEHIFQNENYYSSWKCSSLINAPTYQELEYKLKELNTKFKENIKSASYFFITLGTSFGYYLKESDELVANCHKQDSKIFEKKISTIEEMYAIWKETIPMILNLNPSIKLVFTVSPVRHSKDGLSENNRSKARLFELLSLLELEFNCLYFPSFEIIIDELRDYRFYEKDLIHPNQLAIEYIWEIMKITFLDPDSLKICEVGEKLRLLEEHKALSQDSRKIQEFNRLKKIKLHQFLKENNKFNW
jgi:hypothetical protein